MNLPKLDNSNLWDKTYLILKERIIQREFKPNEKLSIPDLSAQLGVSRTPIRDALNRLEMEGLVKTVSKVGTFVSAIEIEDLLDIIETRMMIEQWSAEKLRKLSQEEIAHKIAPLEEILNKASTMLEQMPFDAYIKIDYNLKFHIEFVSMAGNKKNVDIYMELMNYHFLGVKRSLFTKEMVIAGISQHSATINFLKERKFAKVKESIRLHLEDSKERLIKRLKDGCGQI